MINKDNTGPLTLVESKKTYNPICLLWKNDIHYTDDHLTT